MKRVFSSFNQTAVYHARNLLQTEGIEVLVRNAMLSSAMGELPPAECQMELWVVNEQDAARAQEILNRKNLPDPNGPAIAARSSAPQFTQCWRCGAYRRES